MEYQNEKKGHSYRPKHPILKREPSLLAVDRPLLPQIIERFPEHANVSDNVYKLAEELAASDYFKNYNSPWKRQFYSTPFYITDHAECKPNGYTPFEKPALANNPFERSCFVTSQHDVPEMASDVHPDAVPSMYRVSPSMAPGLQYTSDSSADPNGNFGEGDFRPPSLAPSLGPTGPYSSLPVFLQTEVDYTPPQAVTARYPKICQGGKSYLSESDTSRPSGPSKRWS
jgi:hypothetical protein